MDSFIVVNPNSATNSSEWYLVVPYSEWLEHSNDARQLSIVGRMFTDYGEADRHRNTLNKELAKGAAS